MRVMVSQITSLRIVYPTVYSRRRSRKTSKFRVTGLCEGNSPMTGELPAQRVSNVGNVSIWWRHHIVITFAQFERTAACGRGIWKTEKHALQVCFVYNFCRWENYMYTCGNCLILTMSLKTQVQCNFTAFDTYSICEGPRGQAMKNNVKETFFSLAENLFHIIVLTYWLQRSPFYFRLFYITYTPRIAFKLI